MFMKVIYLQPFGDVDYSTLHYLKEKLSSKFSLDFEVGNKGELLEEAYDLSRKQYISTVFLRKLRTLLPEGTLKGLAVLDVDLYVPKLNFVFGEAEVNGECAVISLFRLRPQYYGLSPDMGVFRKRALKEAIHELGHTFGLKHCKSPDCIMHFSNSIADTDRKREDFCPNCLKKLKKEELS